MTNSAEDSSQVARALFQDPEVLGDLLEMFAISYPSIMSELRQALAVGDYRSARRRGRELREILACFEDDPAVRVAGRAAHVGEEWEAAEIDAAVTQLHEVCDRLVVSLSARLRTFRRSR